MRGAFLGARPSSGARYLGARQEQQSCYCHQKAAQRLETQIQELIKDAYKQIATQEPAKPLLFGKRRLQSVMNK